MVKEGLFLFLRVHIPTGKNTCSVATDITGLKHSWRRYVHIIKCRYYLSENPCIWLCRQLQDNTVRLHRLSPLAYTLQAVIFVKCFCEIESKVFVTSAAFSFRFHHSNAEISPRTRESSQWFGPRYVNTHPLLVVRVSVSQQYNKG